MEKIVVVNEKDEVVGFEDKEKCHQGKGILHRAFTIFIFDDKGRVLIQKRSKFKKLWPLCWETSCSSYLKKDETYEESAEERLKEELGLTLPLELVDKFQYQAPYKNIGSENEVCALLIGRYTEGKIEPNPQEVADWQWLEVEELKKDMMHNPQNYAPWLEIALKRISKL
ncbi:MAG: isopentenyl-diphosphate Delta-isomerase [Candidatus Paceibacterales bacterium]